ncbi:Eukaryotic aspartyl protease family protein [Zostera marina]|uniref:Eukaryotic aspartyl protease family protein n=1 Tax=Zostera marina TaxID=29655 RepID=A0A0K9NYT7_ZOSMR|nr:Eukaryotic aspartyl protease family protein [Zostera marina]
MLLSSVARVRSGVLLFVLVFASAAAPYSCQGRRGTEAVGGRGGFPAVLELERSIPSGADLDILRSHDEIRHRSLLQRKVSQRKKLLMQQKDTTGVVNFPIDGSSDPYSVGLYFTRVKLGNPPKEFYVQIDTGSDILWVSCVPCSGCPNTSALNIKLEFFDPKKSNSAKLIDCTDDRCTSDLQPSIAGCIASTFDSWCGYSFKYGDGSGTSGYYVSDAIYFQTVSANQVAGSISANVIFGCSNLQSGGLTNPDIAVDGIFGFGQHELSMISQLSSLGVAPKAFSHCLKGAGSGGGILVLGEVVDLGIVYTPLVQDQPHYSLNLKSIAVKGQVLPIDPSVFSTSSSQGTIIDSGTTLAYLVEEAYDPLINAIINIVSKFVQSFISKGHQCFIVAGRVDAIFPLVTLNFEEGASLILKPTDYLVQQVSIGNDIIWCMGWQKNVDFDITILGDIVLKDKVFVYDLAQQRIGWVNHDCSLPVNVSQSDKNDILNNNGLFSIGCSLQTALPHLMYFFITCQVFLFSFFQM